jgi:threonine aldolase
VISGAIRSEDAHFPESRLVCLENTHNICGGTPIDVAYTETVAEIAHSAGLKLHIDGARIFNAAVALNVKPVDLVRKANSVTFCLSKGLCAPVGSVICGDEGFIRKAHRMRKQLGGGMRQAGVIAAAGLVALDQMVNRLGEDHRRAKELASELSQIDWLQLESTIPATNMIFFQLVDTAPITEGGLVENLRAQRIRISQPRGGRFRVVTHYWVDDAAIERIVSAFRAMAV